MTLRKPDSSWWKYQPRRVPGQLKLRRAMAMRPKSTQEQADEILARPGVQTPFGLRNVTPEEARIVAQAQAEAEQAAGPQPQPKVVGLGELAGNIYRAAAKPMITEAQVEALPGFFQPIGREVRELSSPRMLALTAATAGIGPTAALGLRGVVAGITAKGVAPTLTRAAARTGATLVEPIVRGGFGARMAAEQALGVGGGMAARTAVEAVPETAPTPVKVAAGLAGGLVGGAGAIGGVRALPAVFRSARGAGKATIAMGLRSLPAEKAAAFYGLPRDDIERYLRWVDDQVAAEEDLLKRGIGRPFEEEAETPIGSLQREIDEITMQIEGMLEEGTIVRPKWAVGLTDDQLKNMAAQAGVNPFEADWFNGLDSVIIREARRGGYRGVADRPLNVRELQRLRAGLRRDLRELEKPTTEPPVRIPRADVGQPEAGVQTGMMGVPERAVIPKGKGREAMASLETAAKEREAMGRLRAPKPVAPVTEAVRPTRGPVEVTRQAEVAGGVVRKEAAEDIATAPSPAPVAAKVPVRRTRTTKPAPSRVEAGAAPVEAAGVVPPSPAAAPPAVPKRPAQLRLSIRQTKRQGGGFLISGRDTKGRQVRVFAETLEEAKRARENIRQGLEAFPGTAEEAAARATTKAERKFRAALKKGEPGAIERSRLELEQAQARSGGPPKEPPRQPPKITPDGEVPRPDFLSARDRLVRVLRTSVRRSQREIESLRATEMSRRAGIAQSATERALARGESPLPGIRAAQRGELPTGELALAERLTADEVAVLRDSIYKTLGPELNFTSANVEEALTRLAFDGKIPTESELAWMEEIFGPELVEALRGFRTRGQKITSGLLEVWNLPRSLLASFDDSMVLRQGIHLLPEGAPVGRALKAHVEAITKSGADEINAVIRSNEWFNHGRAHGLDLTLPGLARGMGGREEAFFGAGLARRIPILGKGVEISERIATAYLNKLRMETYAAHAAELKRMGAGFDAFKELAENINILSGRATLGRAQGMAPILNGMFFSARLNWARAQMPFRIIRQVPKLDTPEGRHIAKMLAKDVYGVWAGIAGMLGLASAAGVAVVNMNPRSSDFGKMQVGNVRVDPWAGQQQFAVLMARLVSGERTTTTTRQDVPADPVETISRFLESKFHPALSQLITIRRGETFVGEELTAKEYAKQWAPLFIQDIGEIVSGTTPGMAGVLGTAAFFGVSVYNIPGVPAEVLNQFQSSVDEYNAIPADALELERGQMSRLEYRERNPGAEAALFLAGQVTSLSTPESLRAVVTLIQEHGLNPDNISGIAERKERQQEAAELGKRLKVNNVDRLIAALESQPKSPAPPAPSSTPPPTAVPGSGGSLLEWTRQRRQGTPAPAGVR